MVPSPFRGTLFGAAGSSAPLDDPSASSAGSTDGNGVGVVAGLGDAAPDRFPAVDGAVPAADGVGVDRDGEPNGDAEPGGVADAVGAADREPVTRFVEDAAVREDGSMAGRFMATSTAPTTADTATTQSVARNPADLWWLSRSGTALPLQMVGRR
jgi:hypothetical protein